MKLILMILMLSSILFSWEKQIILGSYSVVSNGERALKTIDKQIKDDLQLQAFMKENSLRTINTEISGYTVVSINAFESYTSLLNTMNVLKVYYGDAFVLKYPTKNIAAKENLAEIEKKAIVEQAVAKASEDDKRVELKKLLEEEALEAELLDQEVESEPVEETIVEVVNESPALIEPELMSNTESEVVSDEFSEMEEYIIYLVALAALALVAAGITVLKIANSKTKKQEEDA